MSDRRHRPLVSRSVVTALSLTAAVWSLNTVWLLRDLRPPVWDMALHQTYALNYYPGGPGAPDVPWERSGNYPPFVHVAIALLYWMFHPGAHVAAFVNLPATFLLFWSVYRLAADFAGENAAPWACGLAALTPYMLWLSRETILDYWLSAWVAVSLVLLRRTRCFESRRFSLLFGCSIGFGLLTKWLFAAFVAAPVACVCIASRIWRDRERVVHLSDSLLVGAAMAGTWYVPNLPQLKTYFFENARVGALEGEPQVFSAQSFIYYFRLLEGYQLFGILFAVAVAGAMVAWRKGLLREPSFLYVAIAGGWLSMTLLRTKDPRFTMPLLGLVVIPAGAWMGSLNGRRPSVFKWALVALLGLQAYAVNFGVPGLPDRIVLADGYRGSLDWDWNLYLQTYFGILGPPRREDWKLDAILLRIVPEARRNAGAPLLGVVPDFPRLNSTNLLWRARLQRIPLRIDHPQSAQNGIHAFDGYQYVLMAEREQGMSWSTRQSRALNQIIVDHPGVFPLLEVYPLPDGNAVRLYAVRLGAASPAGAALDQNSRNPWRRLNEGPSKEGGARGDGRLAARLMPHFEEAASRRRVPL
jgi:hypothetical protein